MNLLLLILGLATAQAGSINRQHRRQAAYDSPCGLASRLRATNAGFPCQIHHEANQHQLIQASTPNELFVSSTPGYYENELHQGSFEANQPILNEKTGQFEANQQGFYQQSPAELVLNFQSDSFEANQPVLNLHTGKYEASGQSSNTFEANQPLLNLHSGQFETSSQSPNTFEANQPLLNLHSGQFETSSQSPSTFEANQPLLNLHRGQFEVSSQLPNTFEANQPLLNLHSGQFEVSSQSPNTFEANPSFQSQYQHDFQASKAPISGAHSRVLKHFYFFGAPEERATVTSKIRLVQPNTEHVNVIFIKAPEAPKLRHVIEAEPAGQKGKTLVYVLVKNPQEGEDVTVEAGAGAEPKKPEVFYLKYSSEEEAQAAVDKVKLQHQEQGGADGEVSSVLRGHQGGADFFANALQGALSVGGGGHLQVDGGKVEAGGASKVLSVLQRGQGGVEFIPSSVQGALSVGGGGHLQINGGKIEAGGASQVLGVQGGGLQELLPPVSSSTQSGYFVSTTVSPVKGSTEYLPPY